MSNETKGSFEKIFLAGIGALAITGEKSKEMLEELVKKGELTIEQGKALNEELKHTVKEKLSTNIVKPMEEAAVSKVIDNLDKLSAEQLAALKEKLGEIEKAGEKET